MRQEWVGKRQAVRTSVQLRAQLRFGADRPPLDCTIMDISQTGARILIASEEEALPQTFDIHIPARSELKWGRVRWRERQQIGIEFLKTRPGDRDSVEAGLIERLMRLEDRVNEIAAGNTGLDEHADADTAKSLERIERWLGEAHERQDADADRLAKLEAAASTGELRKAGVDPSALEDVSARLDDFSRRAFFQDSDPDPRLVTHESFKDLSDQFRKNIARLDRLVLELSNRLAALQSAAAPVAVESPPPPAQPGAPSETWAAPEAIERRLLVLESSTQEIRASLRTLVLLTASQFTKRAG
jgi:hypothetical protein